VGDRGWKIGRVIYLDEKNGIAVELLSLSRRKALLLEVTDEGQNRKMFSHREHGFPTRDGAERQGSKPKRKP